MTGRHREQPEDHPDLVAALRDWYQSLPTTSVPAEYAEPTCPRCRSRRLVDYRAKVGCGACGHLWQAGAPRKQLDELA